jgi:hypothetical protein
MRTSNILLLLLLLPGASGAQVSSSSLPTLFGVRGARGQVSPSGGYQGPTTVRLFVVTAGDEVQPVSAEGHHGTYLPKTARRKGQETEGEENLADMVLEAWRDKAFRERAVALAQDSGAPYVNLMICPTVTPETRGIFDVDSWLVYLTEEGVEKDSLPMRWAASVGVRGHRRFVRFWILWKIARSNFLDVCEENALYPVPGPFEATPRSLAFDEGWNAYRAAANTGGTIQVPESAPAGSALWVARALMILHRDHGPSGVWEACRLSRKEDCATIDRLLTHLGRIAPATAKTIQKLYSSPP